MIDQPLKGVADKKTGAHHDLGWYCKMATAKSLKIDVSSVSRSSNCSDEGLTIEMFALILLMVASLFWLLYVIMYLLCPSAKWATPWHCCQINKFKYNSCVLGADQPSFRTRDTYGVRSQLRKGWRVISMGQRDTWCQRTWNSFKWPGIFHSVQSCDLRENISRMWKKCLSQCNHIWWWWVEDFLIENDLATNLFSISWDFQSLFKTFGSRRKPFDQIGVYLGYLKKRRSRGPAKTVFILWPTYSRCAMIIYITKKITHLRMYLSMHSRERKLPKGLFTHLIAC